MGAPTHLAPAFRTGKISWPISLRVVFLAIPVVILLPALHAAAFPLRLDWKPLILGYLGVGFQAVVLAAVLVALESPRLLAEALTSLRRRKLKLLLFAAFLIALVLFVGPAIAALAAVFAITIAEFVGHSRTSGKHPAQRIAALMPAIVYLFLGLVLAFVYTNIIVRLRFYGAYDAFFNKVDLFLFRTTVPDLARRAAGVLPAWCFVGLNAVYYGMFAQIGAALLICGLRSGPRRAVQFVSAILAAYGLSLLIFYSWPSHGPYSVCPGHFQHVAWLNGDVAAYGTQHNLLVNAEYLWAGRPVTAIPTGYYIAFPCMHIAQPLIVLWFLRQWRIMAAALAVYDAFLVMAIVLLEWHYMVDLLGGAAVAALALLFARFAVRDDTREERLEQGLMQNREESFCGLMIAP